MCTTDFSDCTDYHRLAASVLAALLLSSLTLVSCTKDDEPVRMDDTATRAMTRQDSIAAGLIMQVSIENDGAWDGETHYEF